MRNVYVAAINAAKNGNATLKRVELRSEIEKTNQTQSGKIGFLLAGASGLKGEVSPSIEKRICWENISVANIERWNLQVGDDFAAKVGSACKIVVEERVEPFYVGQKPKMNPTTGEILTKGGREIYRNSRLTFNMAEEDVLVQHDVTPVYGQLPSTEFSAVSANVPMGETITD